MLKILVSSASPPLETAVDLLIVTCGDREPAADPVIAAADHVLGGALHQAISDERFAGKPPDNLEDIAKQPVIPKPVPLQLGTDAGYHRGALPSDCGRLAGSDRRWLADRQRRSH